MISWFKSECSHSAILMQNISDELSMDLEDTTWDPVLGPALKSCFKIPWHVISRSPLSIQSVWNGVQQLVCFQKGMSNVAIYVNKMVKYMRTIVYKSKHIYTVYISLTDMSPWQTGGFTAHGSNIALTNGWFYSTWVQVKTNKHRLRHLIISTGSEPGGVWHLQELIPNTPWCWYICIYLLYQMLHVLAYLPTKLGDLCWVRKCW